MVGTFAMVLFFTMLKEAYEDYQRYKQQREVNEKRCSLVSRTKRGKEPLKSIKWADVRPGQLLLLRKDE